MKALIYNKKNRESPFSLQEILKPEPTDNQVQIKVHAVSINAADYRALELGSIPKSKIFGSDVAGVVESVGANVVGLKAGDEVVGDTSGCGLGGYAEYLVAPETVFALKPQNITFETAASVPMAGVTALQGLRDKGQIQAGQKVLIYGASGGVGTFAVQLAKYYGTHVTAVCSTGKVDLIKTLGADRVIDYTTSDFKPLQDSFDLILAINGKNSLGFYKKLLKKGGRYVMIGGSYSQIFGTLLFGPFYSFGSKKIISLMAKPLATDLALILQFISEEKIKPLIEKVYPFEESANAFQKVSLGHSTGKNIIKIV